MKTIMKALAALMLLTGGYHADRLNAQENAATASVTADIMRIRDEMLVVWTPRPTSCSAVTIN